MTCVKLWFFSTCSSMHIYSQVFTCFFFCLFGKKYFLPSFPRHLFLLLPNYKQGSCGRFVSTRSCTHQNHSNCCGRCNSLEVGKIQLLNPTEQISIEVEQMHKLSFGILIRGSKKKSDLKVLFCFIFFPFINIVTKYKARYHIIRQGIPGEVYEKDCCIKSIKILL